MYVQYRFELNENAQDFLHSLIPPFGYNGFGEITFFRTYSRIKKDGGQENWADCVIRATNGTFSIRKDWYIKNHIQWDEEFWQQYASKFAVAMHLMEWMPPGRGLWAMGSDFVYERGAMALYNCAYTDFTDDIGSDLEWFMDSLMHGVGVGFWPIRNDKLKLYNPHGIEYFEIPDTREGWCLSSRMICDSYTKPGKKKVIPKYDKIRGSGELIRGFGGVSAGPQPLIDFHKQLIEFFERYQENKEYDSVRLKADIGNASGCCVVAGNVRRSAELMKGSIFDSTFMDLKNYKKYPDRADFGWMSNNSVALESDEDFQMLGEIAKRVIKNGEPGYINIRNLPYARIGKKMKGLRKDKALAFNPCGEVPLEHREVCNVAETCPTVCKDYDTWLRSCEYAAFYCSTVSLLPTHQPTTNRVVARNRRIGVSIIDYTGWKQEHGVHKVIGWMRNGYDCVRNVNKWANEEAGVPISIRVTAIKPGGTSPKLPGKTPGIGHPTFDYTIRRMRVAKNSPIHRLLVEANIPYEEDVNDKYTDVFEYPIFQGPAKPAEEVSLWEQAMNLITVQREWADNAVSNTLNFRPMWKLIHIIERNYEDELASYIGLVEANLLLNISNSNSYSVPDRYKIKIDRTDNQDINCIKVYEYDPRHEENDIEAVLSAIAPLTKSVALLPHSPRGVYAQMPEEGISKEEYEERLSKIASIDWSKLTGSDGEDEKYCSSQGCEIITRS